ncbi:hypothetical protein POVWA2_007140 [Plasmodium ovale wallikeri]|uniref:Uncharacterized protein n=1 Tax=Plasmodium ovale wallikeri TaxID=864142 RepID=A0A1A8YIM5_PLAOA|nr:hypothetical protein POVWA1_006930 [Plasmodium ovale wallikeri]SBT31990.1 hypothetical protein POVWA2_007140 [Plasmodium ovale wallikeri]
MPCHTTHHAPRIESTANGVNASHCVPLLKIEHRLTYKQKEENVNEKSPRGVQKGRSETTPSSRCFSSQKLGVAIRVTLLR